MNQYFDDTLSLFHAEVSFDTSEEKQLSYFKIAIFSKFFGDLMSHIIREYADEEIKYFLYASPLKIMGILLSVFLVSSL